MLDMYNKTRYVIFHILRDFFGSFENKKNYETVLQCGFLFVSLHYTKNEIFNFMFYYVRTCFI